MSLSGKSKKEINNSMNQLKEKFKSASKAGKIEIINHMKVAEEIMEGYENFKGVDKEDREKVEEGRKLFMKTRKELEDELK